MIVLYYLTGRYSDSLELYKQIVAACDGNEDTLEQSSIPLYAACAYREQGEFETALDILKKSADRKCRIGLMEDLHLVYFNIAVTLLGYGNLQEINNYCRLALEAYRKTGGQLDYYVLLLKSAHSVFNAYLGVKPSCEAESLMEQTISSLQGKSNYLLAYISPYFILYYLKYDQLEKAQKLLDLAVSVSEAIGTRFLVSMLQGLMAALLYKNNDRKGALVHVRQSLTLAAAESYERIFLTFSELIPCLEIAITMG